jgi:hypothetical protein
MGLRRQEDFPLPQFASDSSSRSAAETASMSEAPFFLADCQLCLKASAKFICPDPNSFSAIQEVRRQIALRYANHIAEIPVSRRCRNRIRDVDEKRWTDGVKAPLHDFLFLTRLQAYSRQVLDASVSTGCRCANHDETAVRVSKGRELLQRFVFVR